MRLMVIDPEYVALTSAQKAAVQYWVARYVDPAECFEFEVGTDDGRRWAARFYCWDRSQCDEFGEYPERRVDVLNVAPCPYPFD